MTADWFHSLLACPDCRAELTLEHAGYRCAQCRVQFEAGQPIDLRPRSPGAESIVFRRRTRAYVSQELEGLVLARPAIGTAPPPRGRDSRELLSAMAPLLRSGAAVLDLGCGPREQLDPVQQQGWTYLGADYSNPAADLLCDAHALPLKDQSFDGVLGYAVLEHLYHPYLALREIGRVLKSGGVFCGTVSQGEPFHSSYFHMTSWGVLSLFESSDLKLLRMWPSHDTLFALADMGSYPRVLRPFLRFLGQVHENVPILAPRRMRRSPQERMVDEINRAASICFLAQKHD